MEDRKINLALIASGSGTDAQAIMTAYRQGLIPKVDLKFLISTKKGAPCLEKARQQNIPTRIIDRREEGSTYDFNQALKSQLLSAKIELVFLVGCVVKIEPISGLSFYNIHPADPETTGGKGMYGLKPHQKVLLRIQDLIERGRHKLGDRFFTFPTVHEVDVEFDSGNTLLRSTVEISETIIADFIRGNIDLEEAASRLQKQVLPYEWEILPSAVNLAVRRILNR